MSSVIDQLESARKELLDLGLRNPLLNYRTSRARGVTIVDERSVNIFEILVTNGRLMTFSARAEKENGLGELGQPEDSRFTDNQLQTAHSSSELQKRLLKTHHVAQTYIEENGVNILYLALGMLKWFDKKSPSVERHAPLILIPVLLSRQDANTRFHVGYTGTDISTNLSLEAKLRLDDGIQLPNIPEAENLDVSAYFKAVITAVSLKPTWSIDPNELAFGFFSFNKFFMYSDLDPQKWQGIVDLDNHPVLRPLLDENGFFEGLDLYEELPVDQLVDYSKSHQVLDADSSQTRAILDVNAGRNLVIQGPPGTGKSQTITNIIAEAMGNGKKVLFVSEKMAALDVVKRKLDGIGLGDAALALHSHKTTKATLMAELGRTFQLGKPKETAVFEQFANLTQTRNHLNAYATAMNEPVGESGLTPFEVYGTYLTLKAQLEEGGVDLPSYPFHGMAEWSQDFLAEKRALVRQIADLLPQLGQPKQHPFWGIQTTAVDDGHIDSVKRAVLNVSQQLQTMRQTAVSICAKMGIQAPTNRTQIKHLLETIQQMLDAPNLYAVDVFHEAWHGQEGQIQNGLDAGVDLAYLRQEYDKWLIPSAWEADVQSVRQPLKVHGKRRLLRNFSGEYREARNKLLGLCKNELPQTTDEQIGLVDAILQWQQTRPLLVQTEPILKALFGIRWMGIDDSDWHELRNVGYWLIDFKQENEPSVDAGELKSRLKSLLQFLTQDFTKEAHDQLKTDRAQLSSAFNLYSQSIEHLLSIETLPIPDLFDEQESHLNVWAESTERLSEMAAFNQLVNQCQKDGLGRMLEVLNEDYFSSLANRQQFMQWFDWQVVDKLRQRIQNERELLGGFEGGVQKTAVSQFQSLDQQFLEYSRLRLVTEHWQKLPKYKAHGLMGLLMHEAGKKRNHQPIRTILSQAAPIIQRIKPIFMMSPLSIAMYLPAGELTFDLVVFDEASQVRPVDAFGAILRGKQTVVVGDSRQLPPTTFFDRVLEGSEIEDAQSEDQTVDGDQLGRITAYNESILDLFVNKGAPQRLLRWHYRSRHESLIALSNREFYDNQLLLFPSPDAGMQDSGLHLRYLPHSVYDRGRTRVNQIEAEAVAQAVMTHAQNAPHLTLGVAAFSTAQRDAIETELERLRRSNEVHESFFQAQSTEPFFVKNLENVQGDERDVILISMGYGKTADGKVNLNFGPLNVDGGERRLNVLITRSRRQCVLFTNLQSSDIDLKRSESRGVKVLKSYLAFAETGQMDRFAPLRPNRPAPFEEMLGCILQENGHSLVQKVGHNGITIDIAVTDPHNPEKYRVGIECDGETYDGSLSARDRDRIRPAVLEGLGWRILRVWSTEWMADPQGAEARLLTAVSTPKPTMSQSIIQPITIQRFASKPLAQKEARPYQRTTYQIDLSNRKHWAATARSSVIRSRARYYFDPDKQLFSATMPENSFKGKRGRQNYQRLPEGNEKIRVTSELQFDFSTGEFHCASMMVEWEGWLRYFYYNPNNHYFYLGRPQRRKDGTFLFQGVAFLPKGKKKSVKMPAEIVPVSQQAYSFPVPVDDALRDATQIEYQVIERILKDEEPLHLDELERAFVRVVGASQMNVVMKRVVKTAVSDAIKRNVIQQKGEFFFLSARQFPTEFDVRSRSALPKVSRKFEYVSDQEIESAILDVVQESFSIEALEIPQAVFDLLGFGNLGVGSQKRVAQTIYDMLKNGRLALRNGWITLPQFGLKEDALPLLKTLQQFVEKTRTSSRKRKTPLEKLLEQFELALDPYQVSVVNPLEKMGEWKKAEARYSEKRLLFLCPNCFNYDPHTDQFTKLLPNTADYFSGQKFLDFREKLGWNPEDLMWMGRVEYDFEMGKFVHNGRLLIQLDNLIGRDKYYRLWREGDSGELFVRMVKRYKENAKNYNYMTHANGKLNPSTRLVTKIPSRTCKAQNSPINISSALSAPVKAVEKQLMQSILETESPIHLAHLEQRVIMAFYGEERSVSPKIKKTTLRLAQDAEQAGLAEIRGEFVWLADGKRPLPRLRKELDKRWQKLEYVAPEELQALIQKIQATYPRIGPNHIPEMVAYTLFGKKRFGKAQSAILDQAIKSLNTGFQ